MVNRVIVHARALDIDNRQHFENMFRMVYVFEKTNDSIVSINGREIPVSVYYNISADTFLEYFTNLEENYGLKLNQIEYEVLYYDQDGVIKKGKIKPINEIVYFIMYSNVLEELRIDISHLVSQIRPCKDLYEIRHASFLSVFSYIYNKEGYSIEFLPLDEADLKVNEITTDLKVTQPSILSEPKQFKIKNGKVDVQNDVLLDFSKKLSSRLLEGAKQADMLAINMNESPFTGLLNMMYKGKDRVIEPKPYRVIYYTSHYVSPNTEMYYTDGKESIPLEIRRYPNLFSFNGHYIDFDPSLWHFFRANLF